MTVKQQILVVVLLALGTMLTRFIPFIVFNEKRTAPKVVFYMGKALPPAVFGMLVVYCLKNVSVFQGMHAIPEAIAIAITVLIHKWKHQILISILAGTVSYMILLYIFNTTGIFIQ